MAGRLVVLGLGYVGLPLAQAAARAGWRVDGFDVSSRVVQSLNAGASPPSVALLRMLAAGLMLLPVELRQCARQGLRFGTPWNL